MPFSLGTYVGRYCSPSQQPPLPADAASELAPDELAAAAVLPSNASDLRCLTQRLVDGVPLGLVMFGTSVTAGNRCRAHGSNFPTLVTQLLSRRFPLSNITLSVRPPLPSLFCPLARFEARVPSPRRAPARSRLTLTR